tara:strand:+ start:9149 stop:10318 length:1170 start_codon:yes stop_codon:yes gene_type:complete
MALSIDQIIDSIGTSIVEDMQGNNSLGITAMGDTANFLAQIVRPRLETLMATQATIDATVSKAFSKFAMADDVVENVVQKVTTPLWSAGTTSSLAAFFTSSTQTGSTAGKYYYDVYNLAPGTENSAVQFSIAYGHQAGSGSGGITDNRPYKAIYSQHVQTVLNPGDTTFTFSAKDSTSTYSTDFYAINVSRALYKERLDPGNWELTLSGSGANTMTFIDDSGQSTAAGTGSGARVFNIVSGTIDGGTHASQGYGFVYPEVGLIVFSGEITSSIGWDTDTATSQCVNQELFFDSIVGGAHFKARSEEDVTSTHYFCRVRSSEYNYSNNPTWASSTTGVPVNDEFKTDPKAYITTVGLYNDAKELLAVAKLSKPLLKSYSREAVIKVKLDF